MLSITNLSKSFIQPEGEACVLDTLNFEMQAASSVALLGESGSGKSTLLHLIAGLDKADSGEIEVSGNRLSTLNDSALAQIRRQQVSLVFQAIQDSPNQAGFSDSGFSGNENHLRTPLAGRIQRIHQNLEFS